MGTYANTDPQVISRDRHADYVQTLALVGASQERFSTEIRDLRHTDVLEVEENFAKGQKGSSAMPHKRNPICSERISGLVKSFKKIENITKLIANHTQASFSLYLLF